MSCILVCSLNSLKYKLKNLQKNNKRKIVAYEITWFHYRTFFLIFKGRTCMWGQLVKRIVWYYFYKFGIIFIKFLLFKKYPSQEFFQIFIGYSREYERGNKFQGMLKMRDNQI